MSGDVFHALEKFWDPLYGQGRAPKRVEKANFPNFEVTFLEILTCWTKTDAGFGISGPKLLGNGIARSILEPTTLILLISLKCLVYIQLSNITGIIYFYTRIRLANETNSGLI